MLRIVMPWKIGLTRPIFGIAMVPIWMIGSGAYACWGGLIGLCGTASRAAAGGRVVDVDVVEVRAGWPTDTGSAACTTEPDPRNRNAPTPDSSTPASRI